MATIISQHNSKVLRPAPPPARSRCIKDKANCPLPGKCSTDKLVYRATVETALRTETYVGLTADQFKDRLSTHKGDFKDPGRRTKTELASYIWKLTD